MGREGRPAAPELSRRPRGFERARIWLLRLQAANAVRLRAPRDTIDRLVEEIGRLERGEKMEKLLHEMPRAMKCPWKLNVPEELRTDDQCDTKCAWAVIDSPNEYTMGADDGPVIRCAVAVLAAGTDHFVSALNHQEEGDA